MTFTQEIINLMKARLSRCKNKYAINLFSRIDVTTAPSSIKRKFSYDVWI